jgi:hypothetical protein
MSKFLEKINTSFRVEVLNSPIFNTLPFGLRFKIDQNNIDERLLALSEQTLESPSVLLVRTTYFDKVLPSPLPVSEILQAIPSNIEEEVDVRIRTQPYPSYRLGHELGSDTECFEVDRYFVVNRNQIPEISRKYIEICLSDIMPDTEIFFMDFESQYIINPYGKDGFDVVSTTKDKLKGLYNKHIDWIHPHTSFKLKRIYES